MHDRGTPQEQKLMRRPMPQLPVSTREDLVKKKISRRTHHHFTSPPCRNIAVQCRNLTQDRLTDTDRIQTNRTRTDSPIQTSDFPRFSATNGGTDGC